MLPAMLQVRRTQKRAKLLQYAERVWGVRDGDEDARVDLIESRQVFELAA